MKQAMFAIALGAALVPCGETRGTAQELAITPTPAPQLTAGYQFSAALGGFQLAQVSGLGTRSDPILIRKQVFVGSPVTLVVRATKPINPFAHPKTHATGTLHFDVHAENLSGVPWIGAEFELQELLGQPSTYGDGLSFDQRQVGNYRVESDLFSENQQDFEPYDRVLFFDGVVDPGKTVRFRFLITDLTPAPLFYIRFDPRIPAS